MNRKDILNAAKSEFLRVTVPMLEDLPAMCAERVLALSDQARSSLQQRHLLDVYGRIQSRHGAFKDALEARMTELIGRAMDTAYSHFRPARDVDIAFESLSIVDTATVDEEIKLKKLLSRFHDRNDEELRQLNVRIAVIFGENEVKERENPFRPFIFVRCVSSALADIELTPDVMHELLDYITQALIERATVVYRSVNEKLKELGVPARLAPAIRPSAPESLTGNTEMGAYLASWEDTLRRDSAFANPITDFAVDHIRTQMQRVERLISMVHAQQGKTVLTNPVHAAGANDMGAAFSPTPHPGAGLPSALSTGQLGSTGAGGSSLFAGLEPGALPAHGLSGQGLAGTAGGGVQSMRLPQHGDYVGGSWLGEKQQMTDTLRRFLARDPDVGALEMSPEGPATIMRLRREGMPQNSVYHVLRSLQRTAVEDVLSPSGEVRNLILEHRAEISGLSDNVDEIMTVDVVGMLFEFILRDRQVPAEVRAQLGRLQFLILKAALLDPELLTDPGHPARKLINLIGTVSIAVRHRPEASHKLTEKIQDLVHALVDSEVESTALFESLYQEFDGFVVDELSRDDAAVDEAARLLEDAVRRTSHHSRLAGGLKVFFEETRTEPYLQRFLETTWSRVIEKAEHQQSPDLERFQNLVPLLVWSIQAKNNEAERSLLVSRLPHILVDLRKGLDAIDCDDAMRNELFAMLIEDHANAVKGRRSRKDTPTLDFIEQRFGYWMSEQGQAAEHDEKVVWIEPDQQIVEDAIRELKANLHHADPDIEAHLAAPEPQPDSVDADVDTEPVFEGGDNLLARLRIGVTVELNIDGNPQIATLSWTDPALTSLVLRIEGNDTPTAMSTRLFRRLLKNGRARFLETAPLFERSIDALLEAAGTIDQTAQALTDLH